MEVYVLGAIRRQHHIEMTKVRLAIDALKSRFNSEHPLADAQLETDGIDLFVESLGEYINITSDQLSIREVLQMLLQRIDRDPLGRASRLYPFVAPSYPFINVAQPRQHKYITIDPFVSFGSPVISNTGIRTAIIADRFVAGDSIDKLALDYSRTRLEIEEAIRYERLAA